MASRLIVSHEEVTTDWLSAVLARAGALDAGRVAAVEIDTGRGNWSANARLRLRYSAGAQGPRPASLFLKLVDVDTGDEEYFSDSEVAYYTRDYVDVPDAPLLRCYDAAYSAGAMRYHLLLEDKGDSHIEAAEKMPSLAYGLALAEGLAALHARWWGAERLAEAGAPLHDAAHIRRFVEIAAPGVDHILAHVADALKPHWPAAMRALFAHHPAAIVARARDPGGFTLIHGDAGDTNILVPVDGERPLYLIDRQPFDWSLTTWLGVYDLAYAMVLDWSPELRRDLEVPVLRHYHSHLARRGVTDYPWERLWEDYRLCAAMGVYIATEYCRGALNERWMPVWLPMLQRALTACDELDCAALWS